jgi:hypothetical protein
MPDSASPRRSSRLVAALAATAWVLGLGVGFRVLVEYELKAGEPAVAPVQWPAAAGLDFDATRFNLVMFAHPQCPCSRASAGELAVILTQCPREVRATVCFLAPDGESEDWTHSALWQSVRAIPGVTVVDDRNGQFAARFGSATSGQVFLFDRAGRRVFAGGITGARGHAGANRGRSLVIALARGEVCAEPITPVFGCALHEASVVEEPRE